MDNSQSEPLVSIFCITYNQVDYIRDMLKGILRQKTSFPFEVIIHDDASSDGTSELLKEICGEDDRVTLVIERENQYRNPAISYFRDIFLPRAKGKYLASCEGDDFWTNPYKLERQVKYLEENPNCSMVCARARVVDGVTGEDLGFFGYGEEDRILKVDDLLDKWEIPTASILYRKEDALRYVNEWTFDKPVGDFPRGVYLADKGYVAYFGSTDTVYRYSVPGSWTTGVKHSREKKIDNAYRWLRMLHDIDERTSHQYHAQIVRFGTSYASQLKVLIRGEMMDTPLLEECLNNISPKLKLKQAIALLFESMGFQIVKVRWSGLIRWKLERVKSY